MLQVELGVVIALGDAVNALEILEDGLERQRNIPLFGYAPQVPLVSKVLASLPVGQVLLSKHLNDKLELRKGLPFGSI